MCKKRGKLSAVQVIGAAICSGVKKECASLGKMVH